MQLQNTIQDGITASLLVMQQLVSRVTDDIEHACCHIASEEQQAAIGSIIATVESLEQALALCTAAIAMHRFKK